MARIIDNLTGYPYVAGAMAATVPAVVFTQFDLPRIQALYAGTVGIVPRFALHGLAGYTVALAGDDECGFLKGVAGGVLAEAIFEVIRR